MPKSKTKHKRRAPVTTGSRELQLPPIHVNGHDKIIIDQQELSQVKRGKLGRSSADTRKRINHFHTLIKQYSKLTAQPGSEEEIEKVAREMARMGGLDWYQKASLLGQCKQRGGDTSRWLVPKLRELGFGDFKLRLLDVGALSCLNYSREKSWIDSVPIDLHSQEPGIHQQDFLDIKISKHPFEKPFDLVCLSLVVNFVGDPTKRGDMLRQAAKLLNKDGMVFLVLPRSCVDNSRYFDHDRLTAIMQCLGFEQLYSHSTAKLAHFLYRQNKLPPPATTKTVQYKKMLLHSTPNRNNFSIVI